MTAADATPAGEEIPPLTSANVSASEYTGNLEAHPAACDGVVSSNTSEKRKREEESEVGGAAADGGDSHARNPLWKTSLCSYYRRRPDGSDCRHGAACRYAHGEAELRLRPDNTWDPTSERAKKLLKSEEAGSDAKAEALAAEEPAVAVDELSLDKCLIGLPRKWASDNLKSFLDGQGILYKMAKKKKGMSVGFMSFDNTGQLKNAIEILGENSTGGKEIKVADAIRRSHENKTIAGATSDQGEQFTETNHAAGEETSGIEGLISQKRSVREVVTPLSHMPYVDQLEHKKNGLVQTLKRLTRNARKACPDAVPLPEWIIKSREIGGLPCKLEGILESPITNGYRNKCEFSVGYSIQGKRTVGFMLGNFREGMTAVEEPVACPNVSTISCKYALIFQEFLQSSALPVWNRIDNTGFWRQFTVREGRNPSRVPVAENLETQISEVMLIIQICSLDVDEELMKNEFDKLSMALAEGAAACSPPLPLTTIVIQDHKGISNAAPADCPLFPLLLPKEEGDSCSENLCADQARIHDYINNLRFSISPTAFFQVNTLAAERLYSLAGDWADLNQDTLLFDVCCGTGTIGLTLAHRVGMVVGIEMNHSAVSDAQRNAINNDVRNCRFVSGKAEDVMGSLLTKYLGVPNPDNIVSDNALENNGEISNSSNGEEPTRASAIKMVENSEGNPRNILEAEIEKSCEDLSEDNKSSRLLGHEDSGSDATMSLDGLKNMAPAIGDGTEELLEGNDPNKDEFISEGKGTATASACEFKNVVAIVDPPRVGLHHVVIKALRTHPRIRRLVYISCNPDTLVANAIELCTPTADKPEKQKGNRGWRNMSSAGLARYRAKSMPSSEPFRPVKAMAVDLFPHTTHCEMVMLFER